MRRYQVDRQVAAELRRRRQQVGLTQNEVALRANMTELQVCRFETLRTGVSPEAREALERVFAQAEAERSR